MVCFLVWIFFFGIILLFLNLRIGFIFNNVLIYVWVLVIWLFFCKFFKLLIIKYVFVCLCILVKLLIICCGLYFFLIILIVCNI